MIRVPRACAALLVLPFLFDELHAQSMNIDFGDSTSPAGVPGSSYGGAAVQPGFWNGVLYVETSPAFFSASLAGLDGSPTTARIIPIGTTDRHADDLPTTGDDESLLDDWALSPSVRFEGLTVGTYDVYVYTFYSDDPDHPSAISDVQLTSGDSMIPAFQGPITSSTSDAWTGAFVEGVHYVRVRLYCDGGLRLNSQSPVANPLGVAAVNGVQLVLVDEGFGSFCNGDGGVQAGCTSCPCANDASPGTVGGCLNSASRSARLLASGQASLASDTLRFELSGGTSNTFAILTSGASLAPANIQNPCWGLASGILSPFFDGLRCVVQGVQRHGTRPTDANGNVGFTTNGWGPPNGPTGGIIAQGGFLAGRTRHFQSVYRDTPSQGCGTGQNTSQSVTVTFSP